MAHGEPPRQAIPESGWDAPFVVREWVALFASGHTRRGYRSELHKLARWLDADGAGTPIQLATRPQVVRASLDLAGRYADRTWNRMIACWKSFFGWLVETDIRADNPAQYLRSRAVPDVPRDIPDCEQVDRLWTAVNSERVWRLSSPEQKLQVLKTRCILALLIGAGLRVSTLTAIRARDCRVATRQIVVRPKGGQVKIQCWPPEADPYIVPLLDIASNGDAPLIANSRGNRDPRGSYINARLVALQRACGFPPPHFTAHDFRAFVITQLTGSHGLEYARQVAGHKSRTTTELYDANRWRRPVNHQLHGNVPAPPPTHLRQTI